MLENQIKHMVDRFLSWKLPANFNPDGGISFDADAAKKLNPINLRYEPSGTNLFDATQATAMVRHMVDELPTLSLTVVDLDAERTAAVEFLAREITHDQHGPSYWDSLTDMGRQHYIDRTARAITRAAERKAEAGK